MYSVKPQYNIKTRNSVKNITNQGNILFTIDACDKILEKLDWFDCQKWKERPSCEWTQLKYEKIIEIYNLVVDNIEYLGRSQSFLRTAINKMYELANYEDFTCKQEETLLGYIDILDPYLQ